MLGSALERLFDDLSSVGADRLSPYESAVLAELSVLRSGEPVVQRLRTAANERNVPIATLTALLRDAGFAALITDLDTGGTGGASAAGDTDVTRLSCTNPSCPNKRR